MLSNFRTKAAEAAKNAKLKAKNKWTELQKPPDVIPDSWEEQTDTEGRTYFIDRSNGEMYRIQGAANAHQRIDTIEKISLVEELSVREDLILEVEDEHSDNDNGNDNDDDDTHGNTDDNNDENDDSSNHTLKPNRNKNRIRQTDRSKRLSSTTLPKRWQCSQCTFENAGNDEQCKMCMAPPPPEDDEEEEEEEEDDSHLLQSTNESNNDGSHHDESTTDANKPRRSIHIEEDEKQALIDNNHQFIQQPSQTDDRGDPNDNDGNRLRVTPKSDNNGGGGGKKSGHQPMSTFDAINAAINESLGALGNVEIDNLSESEKAALLNFMDFTDCQPDKGLSYLRRFNWEPQIAMEEYFNDNPDHPKSRQSSMIFDDTDIKNIGMGQGKRRSEELLEDSLELRHARIEAEKLARLNNDGDDTDDDDGSHSSTDEDNMFHDNDIFQNDREQQAQYERILNESQSMLDQSHIAQPRVDEDDADADGDGQISHAHTQSEQAIIMNDFQNDPAMQAQIEAQIRRQISEKNANASSSSSSSSSSSNHSHHDDGIAVPPTKIYAQLYDHGHEDDVDDVDDAYGRIGGGGGGGSRLADDIHRADSIHNRMDTEQRIELALMDSKAQAEFDEKLSLYRENIAELEAELKAERERNTQMATALNAALKRESELVLNKQVIKSHMTEIQSDWDHMFKTFSMCVHHMKSTEEARSRGENVFTDIAKFEQLLQQLSELQTPAMYLSNDDNYGGVHKSDIDLYANVANLFEVKNGSMGGHSGGAGAGGAGGAHHLMHADIHDRSKKMSFGAVNELFGDMAPGEITENLLAVESSDSVGNGNGNGMGGHGVVGDHDKRLSFGGVGMLFSASGAGGAGASKNEQQQLNQSSATGDNSDDEYEYVPTYEGIVELFDENSDILLGIKNHSKKESYGGITELFMPEDEEEDRSGGGGRLLDNDDGRDQYADDEHEDDGGRNANANALGEYVAEQLMQQQQNDSNNGEGPKQSGFTITLTSNTDEPPKTIVSHHNRGQSFGSNSGGEDERRSSQRQSRVGHGRGASFTLRDMFRGDEETESEMDNRSLDGRSEIDDPHDYMCITAYYGIEDSDNDGWDSRRSSWLGDYGKIVSRRPSHQIKNQSREIQELFDVSTLTSRLGSDLRGSRDSSGSGGGNNKKVIDVFKDKDRGNISRHSSNRGNSNKHRFKPTDAIAEDPEEEDDSEHNRGRGKRGKRRDAGNYDANSVENVDTVADDHHRGDTYTGVKALFPGDALYPGDESSSSDGYRDLPVKQIHGAQAAANAPYGSRQNLPRPSTAHSLGATFDLMENGLADRRHQYSNSMDADIDDVDDDNDSQMSDDDHGHKPAGSPEPQNRISATYLMQPPEEKPSLASIKSSEEPNERMRELEEEIREKAEADMRLQLDKAKNEMSIKLENEITAALTLKLKEELHDSMKAELENTIRAQCENELRETITNEVTAEFDGKLLEMKADINSYESRVSELEHSIANDKIATQSHVSALERSKCDLVQSSAKEMNQLRIAIREYAHTIKKLVHIIEKQEVYIQASNQSYISKLWAWK